MARDGVTLKKSGPSFFILLIQVQLQHQNTQDLQTNHTHSDICDILAKQNFARFAVIFLKYS